MKVALVKPPQTGSHTRGIGFYTTNLISAFYKNPDCKLELIDFSWWPGRYKDYDLIHFPYFDFFYLDFPPIIFNKVVVTLHDVIPLKFSKHYPMGMKARIIYPIQKKLLNTAQKFFTDSYASQSDITQILSIPKEKIEVVYLAADKRYKPITNQKRLKEIIDKYKLPREFVLYVGGVNWNKNLPTLVRSCQQLGKYLVIVGKEAIGENLDFNHIESIPFKEVLNLIKDDEKVLRIGFVPTEELAAIYSLAAVYVQPSYYEGFGLPVLEAMQCGCPVISAKNSSLVEIGGEAVFYTKIDKYDDLAETIKEILNMTKGELDKNMSKAYVQAKKFSWEKTARKTLEVYEKVLAGK